MDGVTPDAALQRSAQGVESGGGTRGCGRGSSLEPDGAAATAVWSVLDWVQVMGRARVGRVLAAGATPLPSRW
jgi:hypothetical protein